MKLSHLIIIECNKSTEYLIMVENEKVKGRRECKREK
jgi:hypothetical protein